MLVVLFTSPVPLHLRQGLYGKVDLAAIFSGTGLCIGWIDLGVAGTGLGPVLVLVRVFSVFPFA